MKVRILIAAVLLSLTAGSAWAEDDFGYYSQYEVKTLDTKYVDLVSYGEVRYNHDAKDLSVYELSEKVKYDFWKNLQLATNYTYLNYKVANPVAGREEMKFQHRAEVEITPHWKIADLVNFEVRNRTEFRWIEDNGSGNNRYRSRWTFDFPIKNFGRLSSVYVSTEGFYDQSLHEFSEQRTVPIGLGFKLTDKVSLKTFMMIISKERSGDWESADFFGTLVSAHF